MLAKIAVLCSIWCQQLFADYVNRCTLKDTVPKENNNDEEDGDRYTDPVNTSISLDSVVHHRVPVFPSHNLSHVKTET